MSGGGGPGRRSPGPAAPRPATPAATGALFLRLVVSLAVLALLVALAARLGLPHRLARSAVALRSSGLGGALLAGLLIALALLCLVPVIPLVMLAGWVFGPLGLAVALPSAMVAAALAFSVSRALGRTRAARALLAHPRIAHVVELAERGGPLTVALLRLAPVVPFTPGNLALGLTRLGLGDLLLGTPLGMAPGALVYVWVGSRLPGPEAILRGEALQQLVRSGALLPVLLLAGAGMVLVSLLLARRLRRSGAPPG